MKITHKVVENYLQQTKNSVQLVKHFDEVPKFKIKYPVIVQYKLDGVYCLVVVVDSDIKLYGRTGRELYFENLQDFMDGDLTKLSNGVYIGELFTNFMTLEVLSGCVNPNRKKAWSSEEYNVLHNHGFICFHDFLILESFVEGCTDISYSERYNTLKENSVKACLQHFIISNDVLHSEDEVRNLAETFITRGSEGVVIKQPNEGWVAGHKGYRAMKIVRGVSLDLLCTGVKYGKGKREGEIAALEFEYKGNKFYADLGKGWTDEKRKALTSQYEAQEHPDALPEWNPVGKIWEVKALQLSSTGKALRLPKAIRVRWDKREPDV